MMTTNTQPMDDNELPKRSSDTTKQYICYSGWVESKSDGDMHYITASRVAQLYRVNPNECIFIDSPADLKQKTRGYRREDLAAMTALHPKDNGDYEL